MCGGGGGKQEVQITEDMVAQQQINAKLWNYYISEYKPLIEKYSSMVTDKGRSKAVESQVAGRINAEVMKNTPPPVNPQDPVNTARYLTRLSESGTGAMVQGQGGARSRSISDAQNVINIGRGEATTAQAGISDLASESVRSQISNMQTQAYEKAALADAFGSVAGAITAGHLKSKPPTTKREVTGVWT